MKNVIWQNTSITREERAKLMKQKPFTLWFTGLSGAGKTTLANALEKELVMMGYHTMLLDGDNIRMGLNNNLGFSKQDRDENVRRIAEVSKLLNDAGIIVITAFISPYEEMRKRAREIIGDESFIEVYISTPLSVCEGRDIKGLYKKARKGEICDFTGISDKYDMPIKPDIKIDTSVISVENATKQILRKLKKRLLI